MAAKRGSLCLLTCCSTTCIRVPRPLGVSRCLQHPHDYLRLALRSPLPVKASAKRVDNRREVHQQVLSPVLGLVHDFDSPSLGLEQRLELAKPKASEPVFVLHHDQADCLVFKEGEQLGTGVIHAGPHLFDHFRHLVAACRTVGYQPLSLTIQGARVLSGSYPRIRHDTPGLLLTRRQGFRRNQNGAGVHLMARELPRLPPAPGGSIADALLPSVVLELHTPRISYVATD